MRHFEDDVRRETVLGRRIILLHQAVGATARASQSNARPVEWSRSAHQQLVAELAEIESRPGPRRDQLSTRLIAASAELVGARVQVTNANSDIEPGDLPLLSIDDILHRWLKVTIGDTASQTSPWMTQRFDGPHPPTPLIAARTIATGALRIIEIDRRFLPVFLTLNFLRRASSPNHLTLEEDLCAVDDASLFDDSTWVRPTPTRRRIGVIAPFPLDDVGHGAPAAVRGTVTALAQRHDVDVVCTSAAPSKTVIDADLHVREISRPNKRPPWRRTRLVLGMLRGRTPWSTEWRSPEFSREATELVQRCEITRVEFLILADDVRTRRRNHRVILVDHDPPIAAAVRQMRADPLWLRPFRLLEIQAWARTHRRAAQVSTVIIVFADSDKRLVERFVGQTPVVVAPLEIELPPTALDPVGTDPATVAIVGSYRRAPNVDAVERLVDRIMPIVWQRIPDAHLLVIGPEPPPAALTGDGRIEATGFVMDLGGSLDRAAIVAVPVSLGYGMRVKVLEALAWGKVVVTTELGAAGLPDAARRCLVIADSDEAFAAELVRLLDDSSERQRLGALARTWAEDWLRADHVADRLDDIHNLVDALAVGTSD